MEGWKRGLLRLADDLVSGTATAGITFGFLADGRELVELVPGDGFQTALFGDHSDEGWPAFEVRIPRGFIFQHAYFGVLGRRTSFMAHRPLDRVRDEMEFLSEVSFLRHPARSHAWTATLNGGIELALGGTDKAVSLSVLQVRRPEAIADALQNRVMRWREELDGMWTPPPDGGGNP